MTLTKLKEKLDTIFSQYIRLFYSDKDGFVKCFTCGARLFWKQGIQNGHYLPRNYLITRFDIENCRPQCVDCNMWKDKKVMQITYRECLVDDIGEERVVALEQKRHQIFKIDSVWYEERIKHYKNELIKLYANRDIRT